MFKTILAAAVLVIAAASPQFANAQVYFQQGGYGLQVGTPYVTRGGYVSNYGGSVVYTPYAPFRTVTPSYAPIRTVTPSYAPYQMMSPSYQPYYNQPYYNQGGVRNNYYGPRNQRWR